VPGVSRKFPNRQLKVWRVAGIVELGHRASRVDPGLPPGTSPYKAITVQTGVAGKRGLA
jgi:hypothetical protein